MSDDMDIKAQINLVVKTAREAERERIIKLIELASYRYDTVAVNNFVADVLGQIMDLDDD